MFYLSSEIHGYAHTYIVGKNHQAPIFGFLIGTNSNDQSASDIFNVVFISEPIDSQKMIDEQLVEIDRALPGGLGVIGLVYFHGGNRAESDGNILELVAEGLCQKMNASSLPVLWMPFNELIADRLDYQRTSIGASRLYSTESKSIDEDQTHRGVAWKRYSDMLSRRVTVRLRTNISWSFNCSPTASAAEIEEEIRRYYERRLINLLRDKPYYLMFRNDRNSVIAMLNLRGNEESSEGRLEKSIGSISEKTTLMELFDQIFTSGAKKRKELFLHQDVIDCTLLEKATLNEKNDGNDGHESMIVPMVHWEKFEFQHFNIPNVFEIVLVCDQDQKIAELPTKILETYRRSVQSCLKQFLKFSELKKKRFAILEPYVFLPRHCGHYVMEYLPKGLDDEKLESERRRLHKLLALPTDRPLFRKTNRFAFPNERGPYLIDVHESVGDSGISATMTGLVSGHYQYRHYMQDNFDDNKWGCAYRSFQTIWSWFLLNGFTEKPVPSHREIQQALVDVGDREAKFVGSRQWIGSLELSYCLSHLADVTSKIMSVTTGDEMGQKARELIHHFRTQGTPVMIGGGVLAHTILGVAYDEDSGDTMFLILDPHYTGDENLKTIVDKGWCGWKPVSFWDKTSFYNMMLPIRPDIF